MRLLIVRHGETEANVGQVISGHTDTPLTERGRAQARMLGARLEQERFAGVFASDLGRAVETARIVTASHDYVRVTQEPMLRERCWGCYERRPLAEYHAAIDSYAGPLWEFCPEGGESIAAVKLRAETFLSQLAHLTNVEGTYLVVAHHSMNKALIHTLLDRPLSRWQELSQGNTCLNIFVHEQGGWQSELIDCTRHLDGAAR
jgi:broad specificity phosphatase PhoE